MLYCFKGGTIFMNSSQITCFLEAARQRSFSKAAENLYLSQPGVSKLIAALEKELGHPLFFRTPHRPVELTPAGRLYYEFFSKTEHEFHQIGEKAQIMSRQLSGKIRLGFLSGWNVISILQPYLDEFKMHYPQVDIQLFFCDPSPLRDELLHASLDAIVTLDDSLQNCSSLKKIAFGKIQRMLFISRNHPSLPRDHVPTIQDLKNITFYIVADASFDSRTFVSNHLEACGITPNIQIVPNVEHAVACVHNHMGAAVIDEWSREMGQSSLWHIPLNTFNQAVLAWNPDKMSPPLKAFTEQFSFTPHLSPGIPAQTEEVPDSCYLSDNTD